MFITLSSSSFHLINKIETEVYRKKNSIFFRKDIWDIEFSCTMIQYTTPGFHSNFPSTQNCTMYNATKIYIIIYFVCKKKIATYFFRFLYFTMEKYDIISI